jgi:hypothetical protein
MWRCKHVADALAEHHYWQLPWLKRVGLKVHVAVCLVCGRYHRQVMLMQDLADRFGRQEDSDALPPTSHLGEEAKKRLKDALKRADSA